MFPCDITRAKGLVFIQIDGLGYGELCSLLQNGFLKSIELLIQHDIPLYKTFSPVPTNTLNFFVRLFYNPSSMVPGSRWLSRENKRIYDIKNSFKLKQFEDELSSQNDFLFPDAHLFGTTLGISPRSLGLVRTAFHYENIINTFYMTMSSSLGNLYRMYNPKIFYIYMIDSLMTKGIKLVNNCIKKHSSKIFYINIISYDQSCHKFGLRSRVTLNALKAINNSIETLLKTCSQTGFIPIVFSDHGMAPSLPFAHLYKLPFTKLIKTHFPEFTDLLILNSGNMAHIYLNPKHKKVPKLSARHIVELSNHPGIDLIIKPCLPHGAHIYCGSSIYNFNDFPWEGASLRNGMYNLTNHNNSGDLIIFGNIVDGKIINFMNQKACHNGWKMGQDECFFISPFYNEIVHNRDMAVLLRNLFSVFKSH